MGRFFDSENPLMQFLGRLVDLVILNVLTLVCSLPIFTLGGAFTAMNYVTLHQVRQEETYTWKMFFQSFRENRKQGMGLGLLTVAFVLLVAGDLWILHGNDSKAATLMMYSITFLAVIILVIGVYAYGLLARYENTLTGTLINALKLTIQHLPRSIGMLITWLLWVFILVYLNQAAPLAIILYGVSLPTYICTILYDPIFKAMESTEEE